MPWRRLRDGDLEEDEGDDDGGVVVVVVVGVETHRAAIARRSVTVWSAGCVSDVVTSAVGAAAGCHTTGSSNATTCVQSTPGLQPGFR